MKALEKSWRASSKRARVLLADMPLTVSHLLVLQHTMRAIVESNLLLDKVRLPEETSVILEIE